MLMFLSSDLLVDVHCGEPVGDAQALVRQREAHPRGHRPTSQRSQLMRVCRQQSTHRCLRSRHLRIVRVASGGLESLECTRRYDASRRENAFRGYALVHWKLQIYLIIPNQLATSLPLKCSDGFSELSL